MPTKPPAKRTGLSEVVAQLTAALARTGNDHSSVKLTRNAKGDTQIEVNVRTDEHLLTVEDAKVKAQDIYESLCWDYPLTKNGEGKPEEKTDGKTH